MQAPHPVHEALSTSGLGTPPRRGLKRMALTSHISPQTRQSTFCSARHCSAISTPKLQGDCVVSRAMAVVLQARAQSPQKVQDALEKSATGKPPSPRASRPVGQTLRQSSQRLQRSTKSVSGKLHGGRKGEAPDCFLPNNRRREISITPIKSAQKFECTRHHRTKL
jgi:hypothetical protein